MRYLITFAYDGSNFSGFQTQPGLRTVQGEIEEALRKINNGKYTPFVAAGRTDALVHALGQTAHVDIDVDITEYKLKRAINSNTEDDIHVVSVVAVDSDFHARYMCRSKTYHYKINVGEYDPINRKHVYQYNHDLDIESMKEAIQVFLGEHDFRSFVTENELKDNCVRTIFRVGIEKTGAFEYTFIFEGTGFLKYQVRNMVGLLLKVGQGKRAVSDVERILHSKSRGSEGVRAPAEGLYLVEVKY